QRDGAHLVGVLLARHRLRPTLDRRPRRSSGGGEVKVTIRIPTPLLRLVRRDLDRPHLHACERVGFMAAADSASARELLLLVRGYQPVDDEDYVRAPDVGAEIGSEAFRKALQWAYRPKSTLL